MRIWTLILSLTLALSGPALAQLQRLLPKDAKQGTLVGQQHPFPLLQIDNKVLRLAPGGVILDQHNRSIVHAALPETASVVFNQDAAGEVTRVILLRPEERQVLEQSGKR